MVPLGTGSAKGRALVTIRLFLWFLDWTGEISFGCFTSLIPGFKNQRRGFIFPRVLAALVP